MMPRRFFQKSQNASARRSRGAFTLIEILVVVALIVVLAAMTIALAGPVRNKINSTKAKSQLDRLAIGLNEFKNTYGEYPLVTGSGDEDSWAQLLIDALRGDKILRRKNSVLSMVDYNDGRSGAEKKPFVTLADFELDDDDLDNAKQILDPWENPFQYRYNKISSGKLGSDWESPTFLLISAGAEFNEDPSTEDYFCGDMETTGVPDVNPESSGYYFEDVRSDNIVNF